MSAYYLGKMVFYSCQLSCYLSQTENSFPAFVHPCLFIALVLVIACDGKKRFCQTALSLVTHAWGQEKIQAYVPPTKISANKKQAAHVLAFCAWAYIQHNNHGKQPVMIVAKSLPSKGKGMKN